jgi:c-di-GMP-binding flagellar brake protein YcgR
MEPVQPVSVDAAMAHCQVHTRYEVVSLLREVAASHALLTIYFNSGTDAIVSTLLEVNPDFEELVIDCGADQKANARLLESPRLVAVTFVDHIRIQFSTGRAHTTTFQGTPAFRIRLPDSVLRLQRRNAYRVRVPMANPATLSIVHPNRADEMLKLKLLDISVGGIAVLATPEDFEWKDGAVLEGCRIELPDFGEFTSDLEVRYSLLLAETGRTQLKRYGLQFRNLGGSTASLVQRYILFLERSRHK